MKFREKFKFWLILLWADWLVFRERFKGYCRWLKNELPRRIWLWRLKRRMKRKKDEEVHYIIR